MKLAISNLALPPFHHCRCLRTCARSASKVWRSPPITPGRRRGLGEAFSPADISVYGRAARLAGLKVIGMHALIGGRPELGVLEDDQTPATARSNISSISPPSAAISAAAR